MSSFDEPSPAPSSHYIRPLKLDGNFLSDLSKDGFSNPQGLLLTESSVLWLTTGAYRSALHPERHMAQDMFGSARSETGKTIATLHLDPSSSLSHLEQAELIARAFKVTSLTVNRRWSLCRAARSIWDVCLVSCLAPFRRFVKIGKRDMTSDTCLDMLKFDSNCT
ncbi:hypothetical protein MANI_029198 [Metarhizium anisopliae]|nr:hypothetical protein MANI_029198 [Metarhizium anisopliae]